MAFNLKNLFIQKRKVIRLVSFMIADIILISLSVYLAFLVRFEIKIPQHYLVNILATILLAAPLTVVIFYFYKLYYFTWLYVSAAELVALAKATITSFLLLAASFIVLRDQSYFSGFPRSTLFISYFFIFILCGGLRFAKRIYLQAFQKIKGEEKERTLIVGAGDAGEQMLRSILSFPGSPYLPLGFVDDNQTREGILVHGLRVLGKIADIPKIIKEYNIKVLIVALSSSDKDAITRAVELGRKAGIQKIKTIHSLSEIIDGEAYWEKLKEVLSQKLLWRKPVSMNEKAAEKFIRNKIVLITGGAGSIGSELCRQVAKLHPQKLLVLDQDETGIFNISGELAEKFPRLKIRPLIADIRDEEKIGKIFSEFSPQIIFHAAAYKHVPLMEQNPDEAVKNNIFGTRVMAEISLEYGAEKFIFVSTDKTINPTSVMGATKRVGEMLCQVLSQKNSTKFISVRFGNVLDSRGSVIPIFREQIKKKGPIKITHPEMKRYFMTTPEACLLVLQAGEMGQGGEVFVLDMGQPVKILDLAKEMIRLSGLEPDKDIPIVFTGPRPGEKFFEEILTAEEGTLATQNQKIFVAKLLEVDGRKLNDDLKELKISAKNRNKEEIIRILRDIVPNYKNHE